MSLRGISAALAQVPRGPKLGAAFGSPEVLSARRREAPRHARVRDVRPQRFRRPRRFASRARESLGPARSMRPTSSRPGALWAAFVRSPHAHARIVSVDVAEARAIPGVRAVLTGAEIGGARFGRQICDWPVLAVDVVRFIGERVAAVAAETREAAESRGARDAGHLRAAAGACSTPRRRCVPSAPVLHPDWVAYAFPAFCRAAAARRAASQRPRCDRARQRRRRSRAPSFARARRVFEHRFATPRVHCGYIEPRATIVWIDAAGDRARPHRQQAAVRAARAARARRRDRRRRQIVVECTAIGGDFGGKGLTLDEFPCYFLARATGRPVRYVQTYADELRDGTTRHRGDARAAHRVRTPTARSSRTARASCSTAVRTPAASRVPNLIPGFGYRDDRLPRSPTCGSRSRRSTRTPSRRRTCAARSKPDDLRLGVARRHDRRRAPDRSDRAARAQRRARRRDDARRRAGPARDGRGRARRAAARARTRTGGGDARDRVRHLAHRRREDRGDAAALSPTGTSRSSSVSPIRAAAR